MSAQTPEQRKLSAQVGEKVARAIANQALAQSALEKYAAEKLDLLREFCGIAVHLTARVLYREDESCNLRERYSQSTESNGSEWLPPDYYVLGEVDASQPDVPMVFLRRVSDPEYIRYFAYAEDLQIVADTASGEQLL